MIRRSVLVSFFFILTAAFFVPPSYAAESSRIAARIDSLLERHIELEKFNGCLLVSRAGEVIYSRAYGLADPSTGEQLTPGHRFRLASISKQFTGVALMILAADGRLGLDDEVRKYLPELPYEGMTLRQMLTNTSGLPEYMGLLDEHWDKGSEEERKVATNRDVYRILAEYPPELHFAPGEKYEYSNTGFNLLALVVEKVSGMSFQEFMKTRVFEPAGMSGSFVNAADGTLPPRMRARGFRPAPDGGGFVDTDWNYQNGMYGDGGVYTTAMDMFRYDRALEAGLLVSREALEESMSPNTLNDGSSEDYGFGWSVIHDERGDFVAHGGGWAGFGPFFIRDYHNGNMVIQLTNRPGIRRGELAFAVYELLHGGKLEMPKGSIAAVMWSELLDSGVQAAVDLYYRLREEKPGYYDFSERELNALGYRLLGAGRAGDAVRIFEENARLNPGSWNVYDSLAEALLESGDRPGAARNFRKSLELNPENENARMALEDLTD